MIKRIVLQNYMSHAHTVIEPAAGVTILCGPNNCGKSAIASALQTLCGQHDGDFMVRHGEKLCCVTVETDDGHTITWRRKSGKVAWVIDGVEVNRAGKSNLPDNLQPLLCLPRVMHPNGRDEFDVHFGDQKSPLFLIDKESDAAAFFSTASDAEKFLEMQKLHRQRVLDRKRLHSQTTDELAQCDRELAALTPLEQINVELDKAESCNRQLEYDFALQAHLELTIRQIEDQQRLVALRQSQSRATRDLQAPPVLADESALEKLISLIEHITARALLARQQQKPLGHLVEAPQLEDEATLLQLGKRLSEQTRLVNRLAAQSNALKNLTDPRAPEDPGPLAALLEKFHSATTTLAKLKAEAIQLDTDIQSVDQQMTQWLQANPTCPTCGAKTTKARLLQEIQGGTHA